MSKKFFLDKIGQDKAIRWIKEAIELKTKKIIVYYSSSFYFPHYLLSNENEEEIINEIICSEDIFEGVLDVEETKSIFNPRHFMDKKPEVS